MDNWIPVTSPDGRSDNNNGALSATAPTFRPAQNSAGDTTIEQEIAYTLPMQRIAQVSQTPKPLFTAATDGHFGSGPLGTPSSARQPEDSLLTETLAHMGKQMPIHLLQMAGVQDAVSEMQCKYQWLTSQLAPQPYQFAGLVRRIACGNDSVSEDDESGSMSDETGPRNLISDGTRQTTTGRRRRRRPYGRRAPTTARDVPAVVMPVCPAKIQSPDVLQQPGYTAWESVSQPYANALTPSLTSDNFKPIAARLAQCRRRHSQRRQSVFSHASREKFLDLDGSCVDRFGSKLGCSEYFGSSLLSSTSVNMVRSHVSGPVVSTSKRGSEGDRDGDDRKRRLPQPKLSPDEASFRPRRCRKCKAEGKTGPKYRSAKGLR